MKNHTIKTKLLIIFLLSGVFSIIVFLISFNYIQKNENKIWNVNRKIDLSYNSLLKDIKVTRDFFSNETINSNYFETGKSIYLDEHYNITNKFKYLIAELSTKHDDNIFGPGANYNQLSKEFSIYNDDIKTIIEKINVRGFKDYGLEGRMRVFAHKLEEISNKIGTVEVLTLRKHEKDFILRQDESYKEKLHKQASELKSSILKRKTFGKELKLTYNNIIIAYESKFDSLVFLDKMIGLKKQEGLKKKIDVQADKIDNILGIIYTSSFERGQARLNSIKEFFIIIWVLLSISCIIVSFLVSGRISSSIIVLNQRITEFIDSDFSKKAALPIRESNYEIDILTNHFSILEQHIENQMCILKAQNKELKMFIYRASHDLKGPFLSIKGALNYALLNVSDEKTIEILTKINTVTDNFNDIIEELSMVSDIKQSELQIAKIDPFEITRRCIQGFQSLSNFEGIIFKTEVDLKNSFYSDERFFKVILRNLVENSIKFRNNKAISSYVKISFEESENNMIKITVSDNGIGIKKEFQDNIFDMFFRANDTVKGSGLGLYIVQNVLEKLSGAITVISEEDSGTSFIIYLPDASKKVNPSQRIIKKKKTFTTNEDFVLDYL